MPTVTKRKSPLPEIHEIKVHAASSQVSKRTLQQSVANLVELLGKTQTATLLGVHRAQPTRWLQGEQAIDPANARKIFDLDLVLRRLLISELHDDEIGPWLTMAQPFLNGARPIDVLLLTGPERVIHAIDASDEWAYV